MMNEWLFWCINTILGKWTLGRTMVQSKVLSDFNGMLSLSFSDNEVELLSASFELMLVGKFSYGIPKIF